MKFLKEAYSDRVALLPYGRALAIAVGKAIMVIGQLRAHTEAAALVKSPTHIHRIPLVAIPEVVVPTEGLHTVAASTACMLNRSPTMKMSL